MTAPRAKNGNIRCATVTKTGSSRPKLPSLMAKNMRRASCTCRYAAYSARPTKPSAERDGARERVPGPAAVTPDEPRQERKAEQPPAHRDQRAGVQERRGAEESRKRQHLTADQSGAHGHVVPRRQRWLVHPPRKDRQQEAEEERRQHQVLHHDGVEPSCVNRRLRQAQRAHVRVDEPQRPPGHRQQHVGRAGEEQQPVRRGRQQRRREATRCPRP